MLCVVEEFSVYLFIFIFIRPEYELNTGGWMCLCICMIYACLFYLLTDTSSST